MFTTWTWQFDTKGVDCCKWTVVKNPLIDDTWVWVLNPLTKKMEKLKF